MCDTQRDSPIMLTHLYLKSAFIRIFKILQYNTYRPYFHIGALIFFMQLYWIFFDETLQHFFIVKEMIFENVDACDSKFERIYYSF